MSRLIRAFRSSLERDPAPWLLAASAILVVALWNLPIPAFLFAQEGSGSAPRCKCRVEDPCVNWVKQSGEHNCDDFKTPWEDCKDNLGDADSPCDSAKQHKTPLSMYIYEMTSAPKCSNNQSHQGSQPEHDVTWKRTITIKIDEAGAKKKVRFEPILHCDGDGFTDPNVCKDESNNSGSIRVETGLFAKLIIEGHQAIDTTKGTMGWTYRENFFSYNAKEKQWRWDGEGPFTPVNGEQFQMAVDDLPCSKSSKADEFIEFKCQIEQMGRVHTPPSYVYLGKHLLPVQITFWGNDLTYCDGF